MNDTLSITTSTTEVPGLDDQSREWYVYCEIILLGLICVFSFVGNLLLIRSSTTDMSRVARQNIILFISLGLGDLMISVVRGPLLIYFLILASGAQEHTACVIWMVSSLFVAVTLLTNTILALQRLFIVLSYSLYKTIFTMKRTLATVLTPWILLPTCCFVIFVLLRQGSYFEISHHTCILVYNGTTFGSGYFTMTRALLVCVLGYLPIFATAFCYYRIHTLMKSAGIRRSEKNFRNADVSRVTILSICRVALMTSLLSPYFMMIIFAPIYPTILLPVVRYCDYILVLYSAISPIVTLNDADMTEYKSRRAWISARIAGTHSLHVNRERLNNKENVYSICISSADLKCMKTTDCQ